MTQKLNNYVNGGSITGSPTPKKFRVEKSAGKIPPSDFWDKDRVILIYYLEQSRSITGAYYIQLITNYVRNSV